MENGPEIVNIRPVLEPRATLANRRLQPLGHLTPARKLSINEIATSPPADLHAACGEVKLSHGRSDRENPMQTSTCTAANAERQLAAFIRKFSPIDQRLIRAVRNALRKRLPTANELVYDNYNFFVIGYSPTERPSDAIVSMAARANGVGLCFIHGARLPDPNKVLLGSGTQTRFIRLDSPQILERPEVQALVAAAVAQARSPLPAAGRGKLIIRSVSAKQRPRSKPPRRTAAPRSVRRGRSSRGG
jgi:hypothetical protein